MDGEIGRIIEIDGDTAIINVVGENVKANQKDLAVGDWVRIKGDKAERITICLGPKYSSV